MAQLLISPSQQCLTESNHSCNNPPNYDDAQQRLTTFRHAIITNIYREKIFGSAEKYLVVLKKYMIVLVCEDAGVN